MLITVIIIVRSPCYQMYLTFLFLFSITNGQSLFYMRNNRINVFSSEINSIYSENCIFILNHYYKIGNNGRK